MTNEVNCFLIDDDADDREIFDLALQATGHKYRYFSAHGGNAALEMIKNDKDFLPDYIFIDLNMALMDGRECFRELKKVNKLNQSKFIFYSTSSLDRDIEETRQLGSDHFITKPSRIHELTNLLQLLLRNESKGYYLNDFIKN